MDEKEKKEPVDVEAVKVKKKSALGSFVEDAIEDAGRGLISYLVNEQLVPLSERALRGIADWLLSKIGGHSGQRNRDSDGPYRRYSQSSSVNDRRKSRSNDPFGLDKMIFPTKSEAVRVLRGLEEACYGGRIATVADLYRILEEDYPFTANDWGWTSMKGADIVWCSEGWWLKLPRIIEIEHN